MDFDLRKKKKIARIKPCEYEFIKAECEFFIFVLF